MEWLSKNTFGVAWFWGVPLSFAISALLFRALNFWPEVTDKGTRVSDLMAFLVSAGGCVTYLAVAGVIAFYSLFDVNDINVLASNAVYGESQFVRDHLIIPMICYQGWNTIICLINNDLGDWLMVGHHLITCTLAICALHPFLHLDAIFFFGISEITSVPLTVLDIFKYDPSIRKKFGLVEVISQGFFVVMFFVIRVIYWNYYNFEFYSRVWPLLSHPSCHSRLVVGMYIVANVLLTLLQLYWAVLILQQVVAMLSPKSDKKTV